jgi:phosphate starvation-inducible PhoH-like protein
MDQAKVILLKCERMKLSNSMKVSLDELEQHEPITDTQEEAFERWKEGYNLVLSGCAGTGKTFVAMYFAMKEMMDKPDIYRELIIIRSMVPTRDIGFLPGNEEEKKLAYTIPYRSICHDLFGYDQAWPKLITQKKIRFESTSFIRGSTFDNAIIIVDEMQNCNFHELDSIITRVGEDCRIIFSGDYYQTDFKYEDEKNGLIKFLAITEQMRFFRTIEFGWEDIIRSDLVRDYIMTKEMLKIR